MDVLFLGTGAADWPRQETRLGDERGLQRRCSSVLVDGSILIDPGPDVPEALETFGVDPRGISAVLISHSHGDHFRPDTLSYLARFGRVDVYGDGGYPNKLPQEPNLRFHALERCRPQELPFGRLTAVLSSHVVEDTEESCLHYILEKDGRTLFYGLDGAWFGAGTWYEMEKHRYDCVILDATFGDDASVFHIKSRHIWFYHNSASMLRTIRGAFLDKRMADDGTVFVADHLARAYYPDTETARSVFEPLGFTAAYDGLRLKI